MYCNNTRLEIKGSSAPLPRILEGAIALPVPTPMTITYIYRLQRGRGLVSCTNPSYVHKRRERVWEIMHIRRVLFNC